MRFIRDVYRVDMKARRASGYTRATWGMRKRLAAMFGVTPHMIKAIIVRRRWRHLP